MAKVINVVSQAEEEVSASEAQKGILQGRYQPTPGPVQVVHKGRLGTVPAEKLQRLLGNGARMVDPEEAQTLRIRREENDLPSQALGALESAASGVTLGGSRVVEEALGVDPERMAVRESTPFEIGGALIPGLLTGGTGLGAGAARAAGGAATRQGTKSAIKTVAGWTPAGIVSRGARSAEAGVAKLVGGQGVRKAVPVAAGQFVEGIGFATGAEIDESVVGHRPIAVENILAGGVMSSALGGVFGAGQGVLTRTANRSAQKALGLGSKGLRIGDEVLKTGDETLAAAEDIIQRHLGNTSSNAQVELPDWVAKGISTTSALPIDDVKALNKMWQSEEGRAALLMTRPERAAKTIDLSRDVGRHIDDLNDATTEALIASEGANLTRGLDLDFKTVDAQQAAVRLSGALKPAQSQVREALSEILELDVSRKNAFRAPKRDLFDPEPSAEIADLADDLDAGASNLGVSEHTRKLGRLLGEANSMLEEARAVSATERLVGRGAGKSFEILDQTQRRLAAIGDSMQTLVADAKLGGGLMSYDERALAAVRLARTEIKSALVDPLWLEAGERLARRDTLQAAAIRAREQASHLSPAVKKVLNRSSEFPATSDELLSVARRVGRHNGAEDAIDTVFARELDYLDEIDGLDPKVSAKIAKARIAHEKFRAMVARRRKDLDSTDLIERARAVAGSDSPSVGVNSTVGALAGTLLGGPVGGVVGYALTSPLVVARALANLKRLSNGSGVRVDAAIGKVLSVARAGGRKARGAVGDARAATVNARRKLMEVDSQDAPWRAGLIGTTSHRVRGQVALGGTNRREDRRKDAERAREFVAYYTSRPGQLAEDVARSTGIANDHAPYLVDDLGLKSEQAVAFLRSKVPDSYQSPFSSSKPISNPVAWARWERYVEGVTDPLDCLDKIAEGRFTTEHAEALREVYPEIYMSVRASLMDELAAAAEAGRVIPLRIRMQIGIILDLPMNAAMTPEGFSAIQAIYREERNQVRAPRRTSASSSTNKPGIATTPASQTEI